MTKLYLRLKNFWLDWGILIIAIALIVYLEILVQDCNTLLPICIPWMYDRYVRNFYPISFYQKNKWKV